MLDAVERQASKQRGKVDPTVRQRRTVDDPAPFRLYARDARLLFTAITAGKARGGDPDRPSGARQQLGVVRRAHAAVDDDGQRAWPVGQANP